MDLLDQGALCPGLVVPNNLFVARLPLARNRGYRGRMPPVCALSVDYGQLLRSVGGQFFDHRGPAAPSVTIWGALGLL